MNKFHIFHNTDLEAQGLLIPPSFCPYHSFIFIHFMVIDYVNILVCRGMTVSRREKSGNAAVRSIDSGWPWPQQLIPRLLISQGLHFLVLSVLVVTNQRIHLSFEDWFISLSVMNIDIHLRKCLLLFWGEKRYSFCNYYWKKRPFNNLYIPKFETTYNFNIHITIFNKS